jgi:hypothetical protein
MTTDVKLIIPLDNHTELPPEMEAFLELLKPVKSIAVFKSRSALISRARNNAVMGIANNLKWPGDLLTYRLYVFLDSDVIPPIEPFLAAVNSVREDQMATGLYPSRGSDNFAAGFLKGTTFSALTRASVTSRRHKAVHWAGGGLLFVGGNVLKKVPYPFFREGVMEWKDVSGLERADTIGEDVMFCSAIASTGTPIEVLYDCVAQHLC